MGDEFHNFDDLDPFSDANYSAPETPVFNSDILVEGRDNGSVLPVVSDTSQYSTSSPFAGIGNVLGSIGTTARDLGTAVGTAQRTVADAKNNYTTAKNAAASGNSISTFWLYATPTEKAMIILAVAGIAVVFLGKK